MKKTLLKAQCHLSRFLLLSLPKIGRESQEDKAIDFAKSIVRVIQFGYLPKMEKKALIRLVTCQKKKKSFWSHGAIVLIFGYFWRTNKAFSENAVL